MKTVRAIIILTCVALGLFAICQPDNPSLDTNLSWVKHCTAPPKEFCLVTNELGEFGLKFENRALATVTSRNKQEVINWAWQFEMWKAEKDSMPPTPEHVWNSTH